MFELYRSRDNPKLKNKDDRYVTERKSAMPTASPVLPKFDIFQLQGFLSKVVELTNDPKSSKKDLGDAAKDLADLVSKSIIPLFTQNSAAELERQRSVVISGLPEKKDGKIMERHMHDKNLVYDLIEDLYVEAIPVSI